jgi:hypothetical protein
VEVLRITNRFEIINRHRLSVGGVGLAIAWRSQDLPVAFHEAGHAIVALHLAEDGVSHGQGRLQLFGTSPTLLRFTTITPRTTDKGVRYLGETKLTTRWRHMGDHAHWEAVGPGESLQMQTQLFSDVFTSCATEPRLTLTLGRIAYLMGGCA